MVRAIAWSFGWIVNEADVRKHLDGSEAWANSMQERTSRRSLESSDLTQSGAEPGRGQRCAISTMASSTFSGRSIGRNQSRGYR